MQMQNTVKCKTPFSKKGGKFKPQMEKLRLKNSEREKKIQKRNKQTKILKSKKSDKKTHKIQKERTQVT